MYCWALENDPWLTGFAGLKRETKGYMAQEIDRLMGQAQPLVEAASPVKNVFDRLKGIFNGRKT